MWFGQTSTTPLQSAVCWAVWHEGDALAQTLAGFAFFRGPPHRQTCWQRGTEAHGNSTTAPQHHSTTAPQLHSTTAPQHHSATAPQHCSCSNQSRRVTRTQNHALTHLSTSLMASSTLPLSLTSIDSGSAERPRPSTCVGGAATREVPRGSSNTPDRKNYTLHGRRVV
jgi:hypothetical protein